MRRTCDGCRYYDDRYPDGKRGDDGTGLCRYYGPTVGHVTLMEPSEDERTYKSSVQIVTHWPKVKGSHDWCSKWNNGEKDAPLEEGDAEKGTS